MKEHIIKLGRAISMKRFKGTITTIKLGKFGVVLILGKPRSGKSTIMKNILCQLSKSGLDRRVVIFDPYSEYADLRYPDFQSKDFIGSFPDIKIIKNFGFNMSEFGCREFGALGVAPKSSELICDIIACEELHGNDPDEVYEILGKLPQNKVELSDWNDNYGSMFPLRAAIPVATYQAMNNSFLSLKGYFLECNFDKKHYNFAQELSKKSIIIDFDVRNAYNQDVYGIFAGMIINQLMPLNKYYHPIYVIDEVDLLAPREVFGPKLNIHDKIIAIALKQQRDHVILFGISQNPNLIDTGLSSNYHYKIIGKVGMSMLDADEKQIVSRLVWDIDKNIRSFAKIDMNGLFEVFEPFAPMNINL